MVDRQSIKNDLNAIANAVSREENLGGIAEEIYIVLENLKELNGEEHRDADEGNEVKPHSEKDKTCCPPA